MSLSVQALKSVRKALRAVERRLSARQCLHVDAIPASDGREAEYRQMFDQLVAEGQTDEGYMRIHRERLVRTMSVTPDPANLSSALELGSYMHMAPALAWVKGYRTVRAAYYGRAGTRDKRRIQIEGRPAFECDVDLFDADRDPFPYAEASFDTVLCCELIEHLMRDPMHMLIEIHRVLAYGGKLVLTTPNCVSYTSVARVLTGQGNPQVFAAYDRGGEGEVPHVREYSPMELEWALTAAGFSMEALFTEGVGIYDGSKWTAPVLSENGFEVKLRGEQTYLIASKKDGKLTDRYPKFLYS